MVSLRFFSFSFHPSIPSVPLFTAQSLRFPFLCPLRPFFLPICLFNIFRPLLFNLFFVLFFLLTLFFALFVFVNHFFALFVLFPHSPDPVPSFVSQPLSFYLFLPLLPFFHPLCLLSSFTSFCSFIYISIPSFSFLFSSPISSPSSSPYASLSSCLFTCLLFCPPPPPSFPLLVLLLFLLFCIYLLFFPPLPPFFPLLVLLLFLLFLSISSFPSFSSFLPSPRPSPRPPSPRPFVRLLCCQ